MASSFSNMMGVTSPVASTVNTGLLGHVSTSPTTVRAGQTMNPDGSTSYGGKTYTQSTNGTNNSSTTPAATPSSTIAAGNGTFGNMGTNLVTPAQAVPGVSSGLAYPPADQPAPGVNPTPGAANGPPAPTYGTHSGPGVLEQWFDERANGTDPGYEYATKRGLTSLDNAAAARGGFNGGASMQQDSDFLANSAAQREGQLDTLASGASGERQANLNSMLGLGMGLAGGQSGLGAAYDVGGANAMSAANSTGLGLGAQGIGLTYGANQNTMNQLMGLGTIAALA